jgi:hypothetical protein
MTEIRKFRKYEPFESFRIDQDIIDEKGQKTIRELLPVVQIELYPPRIIVHTRYDRLVISAGCWIMKDKNGRYQVITAEDLEKNYEPI